MTETVRLAKRVAELFQCSRGQVVLYIENGGVAVDGVTVEEVKAKTKAKLSIDAGLKVA